MCSSDLSTSGLIQNCKAGISAFGAKIFARCRKVMKLVCRADSLGKVAEREQPVAAILSAIEACACSPSVEVRQNIAEGLRVLFDQPCGVQNHGRCWHEAVWQAIEAGARRVVLGDFSESGRPEIQPITGDLVAELPHAPDRRLMLTYIEPAAICAMAAAQTASCISSKAEVLRDALLDAYARSACEWAEHHYHRQKEQDAAFASAVLRWTTHDGGGRIVDIATKLSNSPDAFAAYLDALVMASTYETAFVPAISAAWPQLMEIALCAFREPDKQQHRYSGSRRLDSLMPSPRTSGYFEDPEPVLEKARTEWLTTAAISQHLEEWLRYAHGDIHAVDALVGFLKTRPLQEQVWPGLEWIHKIVIDDDRTATTCGFLLVGWLRLVRGSVAEESPKRCYREIVDALVLGRYIGARDLQALDE